ncbi:helix-turn-helix domain-containing protein [Chitinophaga horti]|uniref:Helix-turn-helix domain-containing protein n=1 Tax=Chitinophaga horti TaxID=2920382 RepID=A0ABY6J2Q3_9BACT|nr:helix-turn-helix domain-containing protein [Chitinophaga horti]UYQ93790.1 helix-turn-helix domain-containing protein [Chitinophaga horti]
MLPAYYVNLPVGENAYFSRMEAPAYIRQLYMPVQPTVKQSGTDVTYRELAPDERLRNYIYCYWELKTTRPLDTDFIYRVVADGCIDIFFEPGHDTEQFVMGFCRKYTEFPLDKTFHYAGIRFLPTIFPQLYGVDAASLSNAATPLADVLPAAATFIRYRFAPGISLQEMKPLLDSYFLEVIAGTPFNYDVRLYDALSRILERCGVLDVEKELDTGISPRQLRRLFGYYLGDSPKIFSQVVRFQHILRARPSVQSLRQNKLFFDVGYYDQAHFIKSFRNFYGVTPSRAFGR